MLFANRAEAGRRLGERLHHLRGEEVVVVGVARGGVPVALEVAQVLEAPLDVLVVRKLGVPFQPELAMGAIGEDGVRVLNAEVLRVARVSAEELARVEARERVELERRARRLRAGRPRISLARRTAVIVDDGLATGSTARAACQVARVHGAARVVLAVPVAPPGWTSRLQGYADELVAIGTPEPFYAIGQFYADFSQASDEEVARCFQGRAAHSLAAVGGADPPAMAHDADAEVGPHRLGGRLTLPAGARGVVVFAHGSGSSRHSPRNRFVATALNRAGLGTLLFDLLSRAEELDRANVFDIELLARRLAEATEWLRARPEAAGVPVGYFGASTGAAAALWAAAEPSSDVRAVVSRGGRPDLAGARLGAVRAPTLLIVGGRDDAVLQLNRQALARLRCKSHLAVIPGATHLFEEPGALATAAGMARDWFLAQLAASPRAA